MSYLGNTPTTQNFVSGTDYFSGDGLTSVFTLSRIPASINDIQVFVNNVAQKPIESYTLSGTTLTFTSIPSGGTQNIYVRYLSVTTQQVVPSPGSVNVASIDVTGTGTGAVRVPVGTTIQRPGGVTGMIRYNTTTTQFEGNNGTAWSSIGGAALGGINGSTPNYIFFENDTTVTANYTITAGKNAMSAGPVTIADNITVTVPNGSVWTIV
jgi:hypothetical protein